MKVHDIALHISEHPAELYIQYRYPDNTWDLRKTATDLDTFSSQRSYCKCIQTDPHCLQSFLVLENNIVSQEVTLETWKCLCSATESDSARMEKSEIEKVKNKNVFM